MMEQNTSENTYRESEVYNTDKIDVPSLKKSLEEEKARADKNLEGWQRAQADFINYKRRVEQEKEEIIKSANAGLVCNVLPILDDMERAFSSMPAQLAEDPWVKGIELIEQKLRSSLEAQGLCQIVAVGEPFDPRYHDAVRQGKGKEGMVVEEVQKGYKLNERVIRPSKVIVGSGEQDEEEFENGEERKEE
jgi:molecular chaperone GrpE